MAFKIKDRVKEGTTTTGTGAVALSGASATFDTFQSYMSDGDTTYYAKVHTATGVDEWEVGLGTWNTGNTLTRTTVLAGSNGTSAVTFGAGAKDVFMTYPAAKAALASEDVTFTNITVTGNVDGRDVAADGTKLDTVETNADVTDTANVTSSGALMRSGGTMTGNLVLNADPSAALGAATKQYVDTIAAAGVHYHDPVRVSIATNLPSAYDNGSSGVGATLTNSGTQAAIVIDGVSLVVNDRVLIKGQTNARHNGVYKVTTVGNGSTNWVITRTTDTDSYGASDKDALGEGDAFFVSSGAVNGGALDVMNVAGAITFGTTEITFVHMLDTTIYSAGTGLTLTGTEFAAAQDISTSANPQFGTVTANLTGNVSGTSGSTTGNAATATALATARTIAIAGDVVGSASFDGSANISITAAVQDDSHAHVITNVDGLQTALDAKTNTSRDLIAGDGLTGGGDLTVNRTFAVGAGTGITVNANNVAHGSTSSQASLTALTGAAVVSDIDLDGFGHVTSLTTRSMTLANLGYTGATPVATTAISSTSSLDSLADHGWYQWGSSAPTNAPAAYGVALNIEGNQDQQLVQTYGGVANKVSLYGRRKTGGTWDTSWTQYFSDHYHPNADTLTTSRTINGVSFNGSANITVADATKLPLTGGSLTGSLSLTSGTNASRNIYTQAPAGTTADTNVFYFGVNNGPSDGSGTALGTGITWKTNYSGTYTKRSAGIMQIAEGNYFRSGLGFFTNGTSDSTTDWVERMRISNTGAITMMGELTINNSDGVSRLHINGTTPTINLDDSDGDSFNIHVNSNSFYVLADRDGGGGYGAWESPHPLKLDAGTNIGYVFEQRIFNEAYHPNADILTTARTINGVSFNGSANITVPAVDSSKLPLAGGTMTGTLTLDDQKIGFGSGSNSGSTFAANHYSMGVDIANGSWSSPNYSDLIIGYHTGIRIGAGYSGIRFYDNSPTTDTNNTGNGNGAEELLMTIGGGGSPTSGAHVTITNNLTVGNTVTAPNFSGNTFTGALSGNATTATLAANSTLAGGLAIGSGVNNTANQIVRTNGSGYIDAGWINTVSGTSGAPVRIYCSQDAYIRYLTPANLAPYILNQGSTKNSHVHDYVDRDFQDTNRNLNIATNATGSVGLFMKDSANAFGFQLYGSGGTYGFLDSDWGGWDIQKVANGAFKVDEGSGLQRVFNDAYHPNADALTTGRNINGVFFNGTANITVADSTKLPLAGGTMTGDLTIPSAIIHSGDTNTYIQFHAADQWRVVTGAVERLEVNNTVITAAVYISAPYFSATSDINLKTDVKKIVSPLEIISNLNGYTFNWKDSGKASVGVIAQEVEKVLPSAVSENKEGSKSVNYNELIGVLIEAVKEQQVQLDNLKSMIGKV